MKSRISCSVQVVHIEHRRGNRGTKLLGGWRIVHARTVPRAQPRDCFERGLASAIWTRGGTSGAAASSSRSEATGSVPGTPKASRADGHVRYKRRCRTRTGSLNPPFSRRRLARDLRCCRREAAPLYLRPPRTDSAARRTEAAPPSPEPGPCGRRNQALATRLPPVADKHGAGN